ncbi:MAG TPA: class I SAM-dependent methyltransferase [Luteitalea sp.]|nr:class I SAM-dependent methyltransferase [Luteitalea sp.]
MTDERDASTTDVHHSAKSGYTAGAEVYAAGRPDYPVEVTTWLRDVVGVGDGRTVVEIGAGTGAFTARLASTGARICAVEPTAAMRARIAARAPRAWVVAGTASAAPIRNGSADAIVCAQAFHWFATPQALQEFARILTPGGRLALIWNVRDERVPWVRRLSAITDAYEGDTPRYTTGRWRDAFLGSDFEEVDDREVDHAHVGPVDQVVRARTMSVSFVAALPPDRRQALAARLARFVDDEDALRGHASVAFPYRTAMYVYRRAR